MNWLRLALFLAALGLLGGLWKHGEATGRALEQAAQAEALAKVKKELDEVGAANRAAAAELLQWRRAERARVEELENEARSDPMAHCRVPTADDMRWMERRWRGSTP